MHVKQELYGNWNKNAVNQEIFTHGKFEIFHEIKTGVFSFFSCTGIYSVHHLILHLISL